MTFFFLNTFKTAKDGLHKIFAKSYKFGVMKIKINCNTFFPSYKKEIHVENYYH